MKFLINTGIPREEEKESWGDYHLALAMQKYFQRRGHEVEIRLLFDWYRKSDADTVIVLRGLSKYNPAPDKLNIMWNISHPALLTKKEVREYDIVLVASQYYATKLQRNCSNVSVLEQCTDPEIFFPDRQKNLQSTLLYVANSRNVKRKIIKDLFPTDYPVAIWGGGWEGLIEEKYIMGKYFPNEKLRHLYSSCDILLNDHWKDMCKYGFISNRIYDALACKCFIISDNVKNYKQDLSECMVTCAGRKDLLKKIEYFSMHTEERKKIAEAGYNLVIRHHTVEKRVDRILSVIEKVKK